MTAAALLPLLLLVYAPLLAPGVTLVPLEGAQARMLLVTAVWSMGVALWTCAAAAAAALGLWTRAWPLALLSLLAAPLPGYLHALAWLPWLRGEWLAPRGAGPWLAAACVMTLACLPLAFAVVWFRLRALDGRLVEAALVHQTRGAVLRAVVLPMWRPALSAAVCLVFLLCVTEYTVPSLFAADPWALEIFADFSVRHDAARAWGLSLPLMACAAPALAAVLAWVRSDRAQGRLPHGFPLRGWMGAAVAVLVIQWGVPWIALAHRAWQTPWSALGPGPARDAAASYGSAALAALLAVAAGAPLAWRMAGTRRSVLWVLAVLPLAAPAPLVGVGLVTFWNRDALPPVYGTGAMLVLAALARFLPVALLVMAAAWRRVDRNLYDAARLHAPPWRAGTRVLLPLLAPGAGLAAAAVFVLSLGELGATLLVAPPGGGTLSIRLYNYLHYGAAGPVAWLALLMSLGAVAAALPVLMVWLRRGKVA